MGQTRDLPEAAALLGSIHLITPNVGMRNTCSISKRGEDEAGPRQAAPPARYADRMFALEGRVLARDLVGVAEAAERIGFADLRRRLVEADLLSREGWPPAVVAPSHSDAGVA